MSDIVEVLFVCDSEDNQLSCSAWNARTGTNLMVYKGGGSTQLHSLCVLGSKYVITANSVKPLLHVWPINSQEQLSSIRFVVPGRVSAMAISPDGCYLVAGIQESIYIWHLATGRMLNTISKHYQTISCLKFTDDSSHFVSAGKDGGVLVWNLTQSVIRHSDDNQTPLYSYNDHGLPVTDIHIGLSGTRAYMFTTSLDRSCKVYDLSSGNLLLSVLFAEGLHCVTANAIETSVYVGTSDGNIYEFHVDAAPRTKEYHIEKEHCNKFVGHKSGTPVSCLALSLDGRTLVSGSQDGMVCIWDIPSRQLLKSMPQKGAVTDIKMRLTNPAIFNPEHKQPHLFNENLRRMIDAPELDEELTVEVLVTEQDVDNCEADERSESYNNVSSTGGEVTDNIALCKENEKLRAELQNVKRINKELFEVSAKHILKLKEKNK